MKKIILTLVLAFSFCQFVYSAEAYVEGSIGQAFIDDVSATILPSATGFNTAIGVESEYDSGLAFGGEFGFTNLFPGSNIRMGLGITSFEAELETLTVSTTGLTFGGAVISGSLTVTRDQLLAVGADLDSDVMILGLNTYYDLSKNTDFIPYIGIGFGFADIEDAEDKEFATSFMLGGRYMITDNAYIGVKGAYHYILAPTDELGIDYDDVTAWSINATLGIEF